MNAAIPLPLHLSQERATRPDDILLQRCRLGERAAFDILLSRFRERVLNLAFQMLRDRHAAEDVAQEVFVKAFSRIHQFRGEGALFTWLYQITLNECRSKTRRAKVQLNYDDCESELHSKGSTPETQTLHKLMLETALDQLSPPLREALVLRELHDLSYVEIATILELPVGTVRSRLHKARLQFQKIWEQE